MESQHLGPKRKGDIAELHVASLLLSDPALEVFTAACDDGHGSDIAVRSTRTNRWYSVQVKAAGSTVNPWVKANRFRATADFLVAAVMLDERGLPGQTFLIPGAAWLEDTSRCLGKNDDGGANGPYVEVRTMAAMHAPALQAYDALAMLSKL
ncbi:hypothetical protein Poly30_27770 [Planctomycetes bacterium Poly30]|uniref:DUF4365 domain-containing protein n=1 Tax=Saltatorellus ferox TaxID=2528018 RepID=A0A518ET50_9BACT|nr:hypothetical protein Poly30_27770 [Planctomycetes bacterium Poly30]